MGDSRLSPDEIRAAADVHNELGPGDREAVVESFIEKVDEDVGARISAWFATARQPRTCAPDPAHLDRKRSQLGAMAAGSALAAVASGAVVEWSVHYPGSSPVKAPAIAWAFLVVVYIA